MRGGRKKRVSCCEAIGAVAKNWKRGPNGRSTGASGSSRAASSYERIFIRRHLLFYYLLLYFLFSLRRSCSRVPLSARKRSPPTATIHTRACLYEHVIRMRAQFRGSNNHVGRDTDDEKIYIYIYMCTHGEVGKYRTEMPRVVRVQKETVYAREIFIEQCIYQAPVQ